MKKNHKIINATKISRSLINMKLLKVKYLIAKLENVAQQSNFKKKIILKKLTRKKLNDNLITRPR